ncbi:ephrin-A1b isoform 1-T1 [Clarias gariepinus]|uniref:ephrin-A1b isoform X1 n=1 Tax=Clarias gariepinus TaxID=13013 RepID=UPI00234CADCD|nr:ephrin-A1b isoform X1 [Clarias gariepinus]
MDFLCLLLCALLCAWCVSSERHSVYWNSTNPNFIGDEYTVHVHINDYLDIICPHYKRGEIPSQQAERYVLYMVDQEDYDVCKPHSFDQLRWECSRPFAAHAPEKFSEKFQRFTPFTLGKEFRQGESYYYISKPLHQHGSDCLRLKVTVVGPHGSKNHKKTTEKEEEPEGGRQGRTGTGGAHNPSNRLPAGEKHDPVAMIPVVQRSVGSSAVHIAPVSFIITLVPVFLLLLH